MQLFVFQPDIALLFALSTQFGIITNRILSLSRLTKPLFFNIIVYYMTNEKFKYKTGAIK